MTQSSESDRLSILRKSVEAEFHVATPEAMMQLGEQFAADSKNGDIFALVGTLGTGKTHWTKGVLRQLQPDATVTSPTFGLVNEYPDARIPAYHFDFYRLKTADELISLGWDEYLGEGGIMICEWADLFPEIFPEHTQWLRFEHAENETRTVQRIDKPLPTVLS